MIHSHDQRPDPGEEKKPKVENPGNIQNERKGEDSTSQEIEHEDEIRKREGVTDDELRKIQTNPDSDFQYVEEELRQRDA